MSKKKLFSAAIIAVCGAITLSLFYVVFHRFTGKALPWWAYIIAVIIYALVVYLVYLLAQGHAQKFDRALKNADFVTDRRYEGAGQTLCIDFGNKRIANTYFSTRTFIPFEDIEGYRIESYRYGTKFVLSEEYRYISLVIRVKKDMPTEEHPYLYLSVFEVKVAAEDVPEVPDVTQEMADKYPELQPVLQLKQDMERILQTEKE